jgi:hypothetical protein
MSKVFVIQCKKAEVVSVDSEGFVYVYAKEVKEIGCIDENNNRFKMKSIYKESETKKEI